MTLFDPLPALEALHGHEVRFLIVGGVAAAIRGSPSVTYDLDICHDRAPDNHERLAEALRSLNATLRGVDDDVPFILDARTLAMGDSFTFSTDAGSLDCLGTPRGTNGYADLAANATLEDLGGFRALVASVEDLIRMKRAAGRPQDLKEVEILGALREELEARGEL